MAAQLSLPGILPDAQMRIYLESGLIIAFNGPGAEWQKLEEQIERLGFGDAYAVSSTTGRHGNLTKVSPLRRPSP